MTGIEHNGAGAAVALPSATRVGQGTAVEQSRAVAEVQAAIVVAQQCPRDIQGAIAQMNQSCRQRALADRAFFRYNRGGEGGNVTGATVHLARELARCWGNIQYGVVELRRDDAYGQSEMQAWAWDVQTNTRVSSTFVVPHKRYSKEKGLTPLIDLRDVYENNANNGARRTREMIFAVLPPWFVEQAKDLCNKTLVDGGGTPLPQRIADCIKGFESKGVHVERIESRFGPSAKWSAHDVAQLGVIYKSMDRGEATAAEEFPPPRVTVDELTGTAKSAAAAEPQQAGGDGNAPRPSYSRPSADDDLILHPDGCECPVCVHFGVTPGPDGAPREPGHRDGPEPDCPVCQELGAEADRKAAEQ